MFEALTPPPADKILQLSADFRADPRTDKLDLGVGVYKDQAGQTVILEAVKLAEQKLLDTQKTKGYVGLAGNEGFNTAMTDLVLGASVSRDRVAAVQAPGGGGALRMLFELAKRVNPDTTIWLSDPTWANHRAIINAVGLKADTYTYFDPESRQVNFDAMCSDLKQVPAGDFVLLHGCCHNPTGANLGKEQWDVVADIALKQGFIVFVDIAYQGFGDGLEEDVAGLRSLAAKVPEMMLAVSCSKNFALYRERVGCAIALCQDSASGNVTKRVMMQLGRVNHSMPPDHGASLVEIILNDDELKALWQSELSSMRERMLNLRQSLTDKLRARTNSDRYDFIAGHRGMFSLIGATPEQVAQLREDHGIYIIGDSRINVAGLREDKLDSLVDALVSVGL